MSDGTMKAFARARATLGMLGLVIVFLSPLTGRAVDGNDCPPQEKTPQVSVRRLTASPSYDNTLDKSAIRDKFSGQHHFEPSAVGSTQTVRRSDWEVTFQVRPVTNGEHCVYLESINALVGFERITVYIAKEYTPGSCPYQAILDHEEKHVRVNLETLRWWLPDIRQDLTRAALHIHPRRVTDARAGMEQIKGAVDRAVTIALESLSREIAERDAEIDTFESYQRVRQRCQRW